LILCGQEAKITLVQHAFFIGCVLGCAAVAHAQSSSVLEWPPKPPPDMAQPPPSDLGAPPSDLGRPAAPSDMKPAAPATPAPSTSGGGPGGIKSIDVPAGKSLDSVQLPKGTITDNTRGFGEIITDVKIVDNSRTDAETVRYIAGVKPGEILTPELVQQTTERLLTVGLFREVNVTWEAAIPGGNAGVRLIISAKDKLSWIIAPIFHYSPGDYGGGLAYANSNVLGGNKKLLAIAQYTTAQSFLFLAFLDPNIKNTRFYYRVDALLRRDDIWEYAEGHIGNPRIERRTNVDTFGAAALAGVNFTRRFHFDLRLKIYYDNVEEPRCYNTTTSDGSGTPDVVAEQGGTCLKPSRSTWDNTFTFHLGYDGRSNVYGVLNGLLVDGIYQYGAGWLGSRQDYHLLSLYGSYAWRFFKEHNLILKIGSDIFFDPTFKMEVETGGPLMRGLVFRQYRGDTDVRATLEYILPLFTIQGLSVRLDAFYDTNLTWFRSLPDSPLARVVTHGSNYRAYLPDTPSGVVRESWHNGLGGGLRLYLRGVILPLLGVDFAYGLEGNEFQWYISIGSTLD
jgi:outer membrane protein assembly factor BamA